jgi:hypothetical protein
LALRRRRIRAADLVEASPAVLGVDCYVMNGPPERTADRDALVLALGRDPRVARAQVMNVNRAQAHNDPLYSGQPAAAAWHLAELHQLATGRDVRVAIVERRRTLLPRHRRANRAQRELRR